MSEKIKDHQLERGAYVYVRQSTPSKITSSITGCARFMLEHCWQE
jgi:hypothetical protein